MDERHCRYSCDSASQTLEWINAIANFLKPFKHLLDAHVVNFFKDRLWESVDKEWMDCLREESPENLLKIPSGIVQDCWPASLKEFILTSRSLVLPRESELQMMFPDLQVMSLGGVLAQGMNLKKKHEVEILAAVVSRIAKAVGAQTIIDVGAGQGYLAQVLSFQYQLSVSALDACSHHGSVTSARAERIKKHYAAKMHKSQAGNKHLSVPWAITCHVLSSNTLKAVSCTILDTNNVEQSKESEKGLGRPFVEHLELNGEKQPSSSNKCSVKSSLVLAGLHACGDLSVAMLRTFLDCIEVKALVSIGCCYNLLSEEPLENTSSQYGFPMSIGTKLSGLSLGKNARDLACQSAERWRSLTEDAVLQNFELHAFRAAFQMALYIYFPEIWMTSPSIGRQGKALRRQRLRVLQSQPHVEESIISASVITKEHFKKKESFLTLKSEEVGPSHEQNNNVGFKDDNTCTTSQTCELTLDRCNKFALFEGFSESALHRLGLEPSQDIDFLRIWKEAQPFTELIGPYWSLRATLGPLVETFILLDRLLFLQEGGSSMAAMMFPLFDPTLSPRNVAIIARKI